MGFYSHKSLLFHIPPLIPHLNNGVTMDYTFNITKWTIYLLKLVHLILQSPIILKCLNSMLILILKFCMVTWLLNNIFMILLQHFQNLCMNVFRGQNIKYILITMFNPNCIRARMHHQICKLIDYKGIGIRTWWEEGK